ncbi:ATP-binding protein [Methylocystis bryophila]|uniref:histidine kinase n=1 Tax=Methylocystis bryophila TaxID=655015 RepID=A0A1W6MQX2_9HYPH|nr:ATP-binding protein [Methylocystis bryophila]ARN79994.1 two-component sensor histidine kinase [Methylocystis bryophila]BDV39902.1 two-component sensor histidine kinase [Methylocystis bryophila]
MKALAKLFRTTAFKLSAAYFILFAVGAVLVLGSVGRNVEIVLDEQISRSIDAEIQTLEDIYSEGGLLQLSLSVARRARAPGGMIYLVTTPAGEFVGGNIVASPAIGGEERTLIETLYRRHAEASSQAHIALAKLVILPDGFRLLVGRDIEDHRVLRQILSQGLGASLFWLAMVGTLGGLYVAYRMLERVDELSATARRIMWGDLSERLQTSEAGDELDRLAENLNAMLARIGQLMQGLREVSDNIAHDLKTPLTRLRNRAEAALRGEKSPDEYRAALGAVLDESDGLIRTFNALLMIARAEAGHVGDGMSEVDVGEIAGEIAELYEPLAEELGARLESEAQKGLIARGNRELLAQALGNLVDNALKYGVGGDAREVRVTVRRAGPLIEIAVADHGPGVLPEDREKALERFGRLESSRSLPGSGLGLALALAIARLHQGNLRLEDNAPGLRVIFSTPWLRAPLPETPSDRA